MTVFSGFRIRLGTCINDVHSLATTLVLSYNVGGTVLPGIVTGHSMNLKFCLIAVEWSKITITITMSLLLIMGTK